MSDKFAYSGDRYCDDKMRQGLAGLIIQELTETGDDKGRKSVE